MYKKIMFLIITLSIIINVGNSTVVMAKENIVTEIVDFPVTINYEEYNVDDYNANDMMLCEYPMVVYKNTRSLLMHRLTEGGSGGSY